MPCEVIQLPGGATAIIRRPATRIRACSVCGARVRNYVLCDFPDHSHKSGTCDAVLCPTHRTHVPPDTDYCPKHAQSLGPGGRLQL